MSERRRAGKAPARKRRNLSANARRMAGAMRKRGFSPEDVVASQPPRRRRAKPITSPGGSLPVDPKQKPMPRRKPGPIVGKPVPPPGGKPPMQKPMPVMPGPVVGKPVMPGPGPVVGKPVPAPPPGSNPPMPGIKPKPPGGFGKGGTVGGAKKKGKAKIRGAGIERKGLRKAKIR